MKLGVGNPVLHHTGCCFVPTQATLGFILDLPEVGQGKQDVHDQILPLTGVDLQWSVGSRGRTHCSLILGPACFHHYWGGAHPFLNFHLHTNSKRSQDPRVLLSTIRLLTASETFAERLFSLEFFLKAMGALEIFKPEICWKAIVCWKRDMKMMELWAKEEGAEKKI